MSISNSITGGNPSDQLMDLLTVIANPEAYKTKLDVLYAATAENKKYVEAIGPASEIVALRDEAKAAAQTAKEILEKAKTDAAQIVSNANIEANGIGVAAQNTAESLIASAAASKKEADLIALQNKAALAETKKLAAAAETAKTIADQKAAEWTNAVAAANAAKAEAEAAKASIIAKQEAFIKGL